MTLRKFVGASLATIALGMALQHIFGFPEIVLVVISVTAILIYPIKRKEDN